MGRGVKLGVTRKWWICWNLVEDHNYFAVVARPLSVFTRFACEKFHKPVHSAMVGRTGKPDRRDDASSLSMYAGVGIQFALTIVVFLFVGQWLDRRLGTTPWLTIIGVFVGAVGGFYSLYSRLMTAQRRNEDRRKP
jgi:ATP synthase protein I